MNMVLKNLYFTRVSLFNATVYFTTFTRANYTFSPLQLCDSCR